MRAERITDENLKFFRPVISDQAGFNVIFNRQNTFAMGISDDLNNRPVGSVCGVMEESCINIEWIFVEETYRGKGMGRKLLNSIENFMLFETEIEELCIELSMLSEDEIRQIYIFLAVCGFVEDGNKGVCFEFKKEHLVNIKNCGGDTMLPFEKMNKYQKMDAFKKLKKIGFVDKETVFFEETNEMLSAGLISGNQVKCFLWVLNYYENIFRIGAILGDGGMGQDLMQTCFFSMARAKDRLPDDSTIICDILSEPQYKILRKLTEERITISGKMIHMRKAV